MSIGLGAEFGGAFVSRSSDWKKKGFVVPGLLDRLTYSEIEFRNASKPIADVSFCRHRPCQIPNQSNENRFDRIGSIYHVHRLFDV